MYIDCPYHFRFDNDIYRAWRFLIIYKNVNILLSFHLLLLNKHVKYYTNT